MFTLRSANYKAIQYARGSSADTSPAGTFHTQGSLQGFFFQDSGADDVVTYIFEAEKVEVTKNSGEAWTAGTAVYWDSGDENVTTTATSNTLIGYVAEAAASAATKGLIYFDGTAHHQKS